MQFLLQNIIVVVINYGIKHEIQVNKTMEIRLLGTLVEWSVVLTPRSQSPSRLLSRGVSS